MTEPLSAPQGLPAGDDTEQQPPTALEASRDRTGPVAGEAPKTLGQVLHEARQAGGIQRPRPWPPEDWADRDDALKALDEAMASAVAAAERERLTALMDDLAANYPESVFPPDSTVRDSIGATAMRHAYENAARAIREAGDGR